MKASELKNGSVVTIDGVPHVVENLQVQTPSARGGATLYKVRFRNARTKHKLDKTFKGDDPLTEASMEQCEVQFSYVQQDSWIFTDLEDYSEFTVSADDIEEEKKYLTEDIEGVRVLICDGKVIGLELPPTVEMEIVECDPSIRGASATARTKPATLSTGLTVQVPEYLSKGEVIKIDTRTGEFLSRA